MRELQEKRTTVSVELTIPEIEMIRKLASHAMLPETEEQSKTRMSLFVGASRILGFDMDDDGKIKRGSL